jgi:hypothetical protein
LNPNSCDDGWWIDDVRISGALASAAAIVPDAKDNAGLPGPPAGDGDGDGQADVCDNCAALINGGQEDQDVDGIGDGCDTCPTDPTNFDPDGDVVCGESDNCPLVANADQIDGDSDDSGLACDCNDADPTVHPGAGEVNDGKDNQCDGSIDETSSTAVFTDKTHYDWPAQPFAVTYRAVRARSADFTQGCLAFPVSSNTFIVDLTIPLPGSVLYYLNRAQSPHKGSWGQKSSGAERVVPCAP